MMAAVGGVNMFAAKPTRTDFWPRHANRRGYLIAAVLLWG